jgi:putative ABC transport system ATP-binding protein
MNVVEMKKIRKEYGTGKNRVQALSLASLDVPKGEFLAIEGPSGCGKSTLMHIMGLLDRPTAGTFKLAGRNVEQLNETERARIRNKHIGFVFQRFNLLPDLTVFNNVALPLVPLRLKRSERRNRVEEVLKQVGLEDRAHHYPSQLSGGQEQRAAIARALVNRPDLLIADEPTGNLDRKNAEAVLDLIAQLQEDLGTTVVLVTHDPEVSKHAQRVLRNTVTK